MIMRNFIALDHQKLAGPYLSSHAMGQLTAPNLKVKADHSRFLTLALLFLSLLIGFTRPVLAQEPELIEIVIYDFEGNELTTVTPEEFELVAPEKGDRRFRLVTDESGKLFVRAREMRAALESGDVVQLRYVGDNLQYRYSNSGMVTWFSDITYLEFEVSLLSSLRIQLTNFSPVKSDPATDIVRYGAEENIAIDEKNGFFVFVTGAGKQELQINIKGFQEVRFDINEEAFTTNPEMKREVSVMLIPETNYKLYFRGMYLMELGYFAEAEQVFAQALGIGTDHSFSEWLYPNFFIQYCRYNAGKQVDYNRVLQIGNQAKLNDPLMAAQVFYFLYQVYGKVSMPGVQSAEEVALAAKQALDEEQLIFGDQRFYYFKIGSRLITGTNAAAGEKKNVSSALPPPILPQDQVSIQSADTVQTQPDEEMMEPVVAGPSVYWSAAEVQQIEQNLVPARQGLNPADWSNAPKLRPQFQGALSSYTLTKAMDYNYLEDGEIGVRTRIHTYEDSVEHLYGNGQIAFRLGPLSFNLGYFHGNTTAEELNSPSLDALRQTGTQKSWNAGAALNLLPGLSVGANYNSHNLSLEYQNRTMVLFDDGDWITIGEERADYETYDVGATLNSGSFYLGGWVTDLGDDVVWHGGGGGISGQDTIPLRQTYHAFLSFPFITSHLVLGNHVSFQTWEDSAQVMEVWLPTQWVDASWTASLNAAFTWRSSLSLLYRIDTRLGEYPDDEPDDIYDDVDEYDDVTPEVSLTQTVGLQLSVPMGMYQFSGFVARRQHSGIQRSIVRYSPSIINLVERTQEYETTIVGLTLAANF